MAETRVYRVGARGTSSWIMFSSWLSVILDGMQSSVMGL